MSKAIKYVLILAAFLALFYFARKIFFGKRKFAVAKDATISINDNGYDFRVLTSTKKVADLLAEKNIKLADKDYIFPAADAKIFPGSKILIRRAISVAIEVDGKNIKIDTLGATVQDAVNEAGIILSHADKVAPNITSTLSPDLNIKITRINFEEIAVEEDIPFQTIEKEDNTILWRKKETKQKGKTGIREKIYKVTYTNGKETNRALLGSKITKQPIPQIEVVGTKIVVGKTQTGAATWYVNGNDLTCASLDFAFGKYLRVTNRTNGKSVIVKVNDSGPYGKGRIIDLNKKAFQKIADIGTGVINVKVEEILN